MTAQTRELAGWLEALGCPYCRSPLRQGATGLECTADGHRFPVANGIPSLLRQPDRAGMAAFSERYRSARLNEGWRPLPVRQALDLPFGSPAGYPPMYWPLRRQSYEVLVRLLARKGPTPQSGPVADLGAGSGWLAYRLAQAGYRVLAIEASLDADFGLQAAQVYRSRFPERLLPVQGNLEHPPLARGKTSLAILNASLHYAGSLDQAVRRLAAALAPGGSLIVLDTPIARHPRPGTGMGDRHIGREELEQALVGAGLQTRWVHILRSARWWVRQVKAWIKGDTLFAFPLVSARKVDSRQPLHAELSP
jgi:SAM-dependent methyltransferase